MARLPRLAVPGQAHLVVQRGHGARPVFVDDEDRRHYLAALREAAALERVVLHAWRLADDGVVLMLTPPSATAMSRLVQAVGRRYVSAYNRRHGQRGTLWDGRFRCGLVEPGAWRLAALQWVDGGSGWTAAAHRTGGVREQWLADPPEYWALGNTPFEREAAYRALLSQGLPARTAETLAAAANGGWAVAPSQAIDGLPAGRPLRPRPRGRPARREPGTGTA